MDRVKYSIVTVVAMTLFGLASQVARADAIDGDWCKDGQQFTIHGREIVMPSGNVTEGIYDRHAFAYVVPESEANSGAEITMSLRSEQELHLWIGPRTAEGDVWRRCEFVS